MENEQHHYELRSRSRSRSHTPMVPNRPLLESEVTEHHYDLRNRSRERSHTPGEVTSSRRSGSRSLTGSSSKVHEKNMETIEESKEGSIVESVTDNQSTKSESSTVITRKVERRSERQRAKRQIFANGQSESKEDTVDQKAEWKRKSITPRRILTSDYSSEEGEREDPPSRLGSAYEIYKKAGDWWNVFPKTDYTYSQTSQYRYEIAPGILAMPNMSRRSIRTDSDSNNSIPQINYQSSSQISGRTTESGFSDTTDMGSLIHLPEDNYDTSYAYISSSAKSTAYKKTHVEQYTSHKEIIYSDLENSIYPWQRFLSQTKTSSRYTDRYDSSQLDSDTELDDNFTSSVKTNQRWKIVQWFTYFTTLITIWFKKTVEFFKFKSDKKTYYYSPQAHRSYHESKWNTLWKSLDYYSQKTYFFFVRILVFDAWLLSHFTGLRKRLPGRGRKILWITLLPLLLLLGAYIAQEHFFTCVDSLRNVQYGVTETTYHIFNDITTNLTSLDYESFVKNIVALKDYSMRLLPSVNVSLPEMPPIGWNITW